MSFELKYRSFVAVEELQPNECTIHRATNAEKTRRYWLLWFYVPRETDGVLEAFAVPVAPRGVYTESGPGGRTWGLNWIEGVKWMVSPSINVLDHKDARLVLAGAQPVGKSVWHQTPMIIGVPLDEVWTKPGATP